MFATIVGPYVPIAGEPGAALAATIADQLEAGLGMLTDGRLHRVVDAAGVRDAVGAWRAADAVGHHLAAAAGIDPPLIKACLVGPWTVGAGSATPVLEATPHVRDAVEALFEAGAQVVQLTEPGIGDIAADDGEAARLLEATLGRVARDAQGHLSLAMAGGQPTAIPHERLFAAPFASYLFDLIRSPDDWGYCTRAPHGSGLIVAVGDSRTHDPDTLEVSVWGGRYAASMGGRGPDRVGLCMSAGLELLPRDIARTKLRALSAAAGTAALPGAELTAAIDPRAVDARSAAMGHVRRRG